jgi:DNA-binding response OmpR family regulator
MNAQRILIVDDDPAIRKFIRANLSARGYDVLQATDGTAALQIIEQELPDLILLDIMMPELDGFEVCRRTREWSAIPIIMLSAREGETDKVSCLDLGADDYLTKPFSLRELLSRIKAVLRRTQDKAHSTAKPRYTCGELVVDLNSNRVSLGEKELTLTSTEYKILTFLVANAGQVITPDQLLTKVWGEDYIGDNQLLQVNVCRLRRKLKDKAKSPKYIQTKSGIGYSILKGN